MSEFKSDPRCNICKHRAGKHGGLGCLGNAGTKEKPRACNCTKTKQQVWEQGKSNRKSFGNKKGSSR